MRIKANGITINVLEHPARDATANRPALIFLHYFGGSSRTWTEVINHLSVDYRCIAPDLRGFGDSDAPTNGYAVNDYADDIAALIARMNVKNYVLVGHSMGGKIALALAARRLIGLRSLVLLAPSPPTPEPMPNDARARLLATHGDRQAAEETLRKITAHPLPACIFHRTVEDCLRSALPAWRAWLERGSREDISADATNVNVPTVVVAGGADEPLTAEFLRREVVERVVGAQLTTLPGVKHLLPLEDSLKTAELINDHCQQTSLASCTSLDNTTT